MAKLFPLEEHPYTYIPVATIYAPRCETNSQTSLTSEISSSVEIDCRSNSSMTFIVFAVDLPSSLKIKNALILLLSKGQRQNFCLQFFKKR